MLILLIAAIVIILLICGVGMYNNCISLMNTVKEAFSTMDVYLKKRWDLIPNLVETVKGYAKHEQNTLEEVVALRNSAYDSMSVEEKINTNEKLQLGIGKLMMLTENYPDLKADKNYLELSNQLVKIEDEIANSRKYYNGAVKKYNTTIEMVPGNIIASMFHFKAYKMFEIETNERESVKIEL